MNQVLVEKLPNGKVYVTDSTGFVGVYSEAQYERVRSMENIIQRLAAWPADYRQDGLRDVFALVDTLAAEAK